VFEVNLVTLSWQPPGDHASHISPHYDAETQAQNEPEHIFANVNYLERPPSCRKLSAVTPMNDFEKLGLVVAGVAGFILYINLLCALIAWWSGWRWLAARFRYQEDFRQQIGFWQSARMRFGAQYNNALKVGADVVGLYLSTIWIVPQHPPLLIPWHEVHFVERKSFWIWTFLTFRLGNQERIPFTISEKLVKQIQAAPGVPPMLIPHNE